MQRPILGLTVNNFYDLWIWRQALIRTLQGAGFEVLAVGPPGPYEEAVARLGCRVDTYPLDRRGLNPVGELRSLTGLYAIYRRWRPVIAHHFTIKPNLYGTLAARLAGVPVVVATVTGLGYIWTDDGPKARVLRAVLGPVYRQVLRLADAVIYLNEDDRLELIEGEIVTMAPIGDQHAGIVDFRAEFFFRHLGDKVQVRVQSPIRLGEHSEPQPDLALLKRRPDFYRDRHRVR